MHLLKVLSPGPHKHLFFMEEEEEKEEEERVGREKQEKLPSRTFLYLKKSGVWISGDRFSCICIYVCGL